MLGLFLSPGAYAQSFRVYRTAGAATFNLVDWEARQLAEHGLAIAERLFTASGSRSDDALLIQEYLQMPVPVRGSRRWEAERAIERVMAETINQAAIGSPFAVPIPGLFPPVAVRFTAPPSVLIVSPRDRIAVVQSVFLQPGIGPASSEAIQKRVDSLGVSSFVTPIGGLATYPAMVVESASAVDLLVSVAHEWTHAFLLFRPLGWRYWSGPEERAINETVADLVGHELGGLVAEQVGIPLASPVAPVRDDQTFRHEMRVTRLEVDRLLTAGQVGEAEAYMELRRQEIEALGYRLPTLNQAFFAFHGSYAESGAGDNRLAETVRALRRNSPSLASFLNRASGVQSLDELTREVSALAS
jgi:hypothetical protein